MVYAGYAPTKYASPPASRPQAALSAVQSMESLEVIGKLVRNIVVAPTDAKFRQVKLANAKVSAAILGEPHALDALLALGWEKSPGAAGGEPEVLVAQRVFTMADVRLVEEAKDALKKAQRDALTKTVRERSRAAGQEGVRAASRAEVLAALAADRAERSAAAPAQGSKAQALPGGANMKTASDLGINSGGCC